MRLKPFRRQTIDLDEVRVVHVGHFEKPKGLGRGSD